ncbi:endonuclease/exonuclease/phosphatase family protein [Paracoccus sediminicola]|nr:endonuclease/exonuclease/phosphatase family protein [Paracoccus sediminicola]WBU58403.1 endonuclease/exonuclease/phosphatase family protein [Paracoccus sediminicola]
MTAAWAAALLAPLFLCGAACSETIRVASYDPGLTRKGPGLLLRDLRSGDDSQIGAVVSVITGARPDILLLTGIDWDHERAALSEFAALLRESGADYPHLLALRPNSGLPSGADLDGDGRLGEAEDAQGWGSFTGQNAMALLSRFPLGEVTDYSDLLWRDLPGNLMGDALSPSAAQVQRLSDSGHWAVEILTEPPLYLLAFSAAPPVFDGPEDRNGRRNHDEIAFWKDHLPSQPFVLAGNANLDPLDGEGRHKAIRELLADPRLQDPVPRSAGASAASDPDHRGDPALDTVDWPDGAPGNLRVSYVLPSADLRLSGAATVWPAPGTRAAETVARASDHRMVWVDVELRQ